MSFDAAAFGPITFEPPADRSPSAYDMQYTWKPEWDV